MNHKLLSSAGCLFLLLASLAPGIVGHDERGSFGGIPGGVSGRYVGSASPALIDNDAPAGEGQYADTISAGAILCDMEVTGDGTAPFPQDEVRVDGGAGGSFPDTNDDGGQGGACHTNHYLYGAYNTPGCPAGTAYAANVAGQDVFLGAACDWKSVEGGTPQSDILLLCIVNSFLSGQVLNSIDCLLAFLACLGNPTGCTSDGNEFCGSDGAADGINYGYGSAAYPTAVADQGDVALGLNPSGGCLSSDSTALVFVFDAVNAVGSVTPALTGEILQGWPSPGIGLILPDVLARTDLDVEGSLLTGSTTDDACTGHTDNDRKTCNATCNANRKLRVHVDLDDGGEVGEAKTVCSDQDANCAKPPSGDPCTATSLGYTALSSGWNCHFEYHDTNWYQPDNGFQYACTASPPASASSSAVDGRGITAAAQAIDPAGDALLAELLAALKDDSAHQFVPVDADQGMVVRVKGGVAVGIGCDLVSCWVLPSLCKATPDGLRCDAA